MPTTATIPFYKQAKNLTSLQLSGGNPDSTGLITWSTPIDLAVLATASQTFEAFDIDVTFNNVSIRPADSIIDNMVPEYLGFTATVQEIAPANGIGNLNLLATTYNYFRVIAKFRPIGALAAADNCVAFMGVIAGLTTGIQQGKNVDKLTLAPCGRTLYIGNTAGIPY